MNPYPSPVVEQIRAHERIRRRAFGGTSSRMDDILPEPVDIYVPEHVLRGLPYFLNVLVANQERERESDEARIRCSYR